MSIHQFLPLQSQHNPVAIAIKDPTNQLTYHQLNSKVNQLANYLRKQAVKPQVLVGIYAERSIDLAIAILGVLQAGGAYVPIDPAYPRDRLATILDRTPLQLILTQQHLAADLQHTGISLCCLDTQWAEIATESTEFAPIPTTPDRLAYIMYTSGSTGNPQGVEITIGQVERYLHAVNEFVCIQPDDIYLHTASFAFSSSIRQLLVPLAQGAKVVIASTENTTNLLSLIELIHTEQITVFDTVASVWNYLLIALEQMGAQLVDTQLRLLIFSGGLLTAQLLNRVRSQFPHPPQIINIYGQTETIGVSAYPIPSDFSKEDGYVPVGTAYPHNQLYLLDEQFQPVAAAEIGELYIGGGSLPRGYLNNPQLNQRKFIPNPFATNTRSDRQPELLYKTGDLARYLADGNLEIVGRQDFQVKIRGMRVEIEEIETVLMQHPDVQQAAVIGRKDRNGEQTIVAYLVANGQPINLSQLRSFLQTKLADYMIPAAFEMLDELPLTPNKKLDRHRLPVPSRAQVTVVAARDRLELELVAIWEKVLGVVPIGINDNFFELGGHSLIALLLFIHIKQRWHKQLLLPVLFASPTIAELAEVIRQEEYIQPWSPLVTLAPGGTRPPLFCIHPIGGNLLSYYQLAKELGTDRPIYGLQARGVDGVSQPFDRIEDIASYSIESIQTIQPHGPYLLLGYSFGGIVAFEMARQLTHLGQQVSFLGLLDIRCPTLDRVDLSFFQWLNLHLNKLSKLTITEQAKYCLDRLFSKNSTAYRDEIVSELCQLEIFMPKLLNVLDCNLKARDNYQPQVYQGRATLFWTEYQSLFIDRYPDLGWGKLVAGGIEIQPIAGSHITLMTEPYVVILAEKLRLCIERAGTDLNLRI